MSHAAPQRDQPYSRYLLGTAFLRYPDVRASYTRVIAMLTRRYTAPGRFYHTVAHVEQCMETAAARWHRLLSPQLILAIWFHDVVYDIMASDNEERSADCAVAWLTAAGVPAATVFEVANLIICTQHRTAPKTEAEKLLVDSDMSILGAGAVRYAAYCEGVKNEFLFAGGAELLWKIKRAEWIHKTLDKSRIFHSDGFSDLEPLARANLRFELESL